jgi:hypothetical protein
MELSMPATQGTIRLFGVILASIALIVCQSGCRWIHGGAGSFSLFRPEAEPIFEHNASKVEIIDRLNANTSRIRSWRSEDLVIKVKSPASPIPISLGASIAVEAPRNFRLRAHSTLANADMGSNNQRLWFWVQPGPIDNVVTARHEDVPMIQRFEQLPFDPEWLMEVLGVVPLERSQVQLHSPADPRSHFSSLVFDRSAPDGRRYRRIVTIDNRSGTIVEHRLVDLSNPSAILALATLKDHRVIDGTILPHRVVLEWPMTKTRFEMVLKDVQVNVAIDENQWKVPQMDKFPTIDLGERIAAHHGLDRRPIVEQPEPPPFADGHGRQSLQDKLDRLRQPDQISAAPDRDSEPSFQSADRVKRYSFD